MKTNIGTTDRIVRVVVFLILAGLYLTHIVTGTLGIILLVIGILSLLTSIIGFCGAYTLFGITTCPLKKSK